MRDIEYQTVHVSKHRPWWWELLFYWIAVLAVLNFISQVDAAINPCDRAPWTCEVSFE